MVLSNALTKFVDVVSSFVILASNTGMWSLTAGMGAEDFANKRLKKFL